MEQLPFFLVWISEKKWSKNYSDKLRIYNKRISKKCVFFTYKKLTKFSKDFQNDGFYKAIRVWCNFIEERFHIKKNKRVRKTVIDDHIIIMIFLVISAVTLLGTCIELIEFIGFSIIGQSDTIFSPGFKVGGFNNYEDTMTDIIVNLIGATLGVLYYYFFKYKKMPWLKYK
jgi:hypothetical protein